MALGSSTHFTFLKLSDSKNSVEMEFGDFLSTFIYSESHDADPYWFLEVGMLYGRDVEDLRILDSGVLDFKLILHFGDISRPVAIRSGAIVNDPEVDVYGRRSTYRYRIVGEPKIEGVVNE